MKKYFKKIFLGVIVLLCIWFSIHVIASKYAFYEMNSPNSILSKGKKLINESSHYLVKGSLKRQKMISNMVYHGKSDTDTLAYLLNEIKKHPNDVALNHYASEVALKLGDFKTLKKYSYRALAIEPDNQELISNALLAAHANDDNEHAKEFSKRLFLATKDPEIKKNVFDMIQTNNKINELFEKIRLIEDKNSKLLSGKRKKGYFKIYMHNDDEIDKIHEEIDKINDAYDKKYPFPADN